MINDALRDIRRLYEEKQFDRALATIDLYVGSSDTPTEILILKGRLIQLSESGRYSIDEAEKCFLDVLERDKNNISALIEMGWLNSNVKGDADSGKRYFLSALGICEDLTEEIQRGLLED